LPGRGTEESLRELKFCAMRFNSAYYTVISISFYSWVSMQLRQTELRGFAQKVFRKWLPKSGIHKSDFLKQNSHSHCGLSLVLEWGGCGNRFKFVGESDIKDITLNVRRIDQKSFVEITILRNCW